MQQLRSSHRTVHATRIDACVIPSSELSARWRGLCIQDPDEALLQDLRKQAPGAFESLVKRHRARLLKTAKRITNSYEEAEEAVQDTFLNVHRHIPTFRGESKLSSWLTGITRNNALMIIRRRHPVLSLDTTPEYEERHISNTLIATGPSPEDICIGHELWGRLLLSIQRLSPPSRDVLALRFTRDMQITEIAQLLGLSDSTVKARLHRTTRKLRDAHKDYLSWTRIKRNQRILRNLLRNDRNSKCPVQSTVEDGKPDDRGDTRSW